MEKDNSKEILDNVYQREYKDRLFKYIFGRDTEDSKMWRLDLYNALNGTDYKDPDALTLNTIENVIYITMHNDVSFLIDSEMNLYEQQSTYNPNMPLRGLFYLSQLYQIYLTQNGKNILSSHLVKIPTPKFVVFYNGKKSEPGSWKMRLSDAFIKGNKNGDFEWTADIVNIHPEHNKILQKKCKPLYDYIRYVKRIYENSYAGMDKKTSIEQAVEWAVKENLLNGFFKNQKAEVIGMSLTEYNEEECIRTWREDGYEDGREAKALEDARNLKANGVDLELIAKCVGLPLETVRQL